MSNTSHSEIQGPQLVPEPLIDAEQAAKFMGCSPRSLKRRAERGEIPAMKTGNKWMFRASLLDAWCNQRLMSNCSNNQEQKGA